jgi:FKBP-type peptidyl-prolyl cis-trans isomerase
MSFTGCKIRRLSLLFLSGLVFIMTSPGSVMGGQRFASQAEDTQASATSYWRDLAQSAYQAFEKGDKTTAATMARSLEMAWDSGSAPLKESLPETWRSIDSAMDAFIEPLTAVANAAPDPKAVHSAYEEFLGRLERVNDTFVGDKSLRVIRTSSGLVCVVTKQGNGRQPKPGEIVVLRSTVILPDGGEFRRPRADGKPVWYWLLPDRQPPGLVEAMTLLHIGDSAVLVLPAPLGYGGNGRSGNPAVPPNSALTYIVDILDVKSNDVAAMMLETIEKSGVDAGIKQYRDLQQRGFPNLYTDQDQMDGLGFRLLESGDAEGAIKILELDVEAYPDSAKVYDSLGEAYAKSGDKTRAIENYKKALAIDPTLETSIKALEELRKLKP